MIKCPKCQMVSHNENDREHRYCGNCHQFHDTMQLPCEYCGEIVQPSELMAPMPVNHLHAECGFRMAAGSLGHLQKRCSCFFGDAGVEDPEGMTRRQAAQAAWNYYQKNPTCLDANVRDPAKS